MSEKEDITDGGVTLPDGEEIPTIDLGEAIDSYVENMTAAEKDVQLRIILLLRQSETYCDFVDSHFDIHTALHHDTKEIDIAVIEKPRVEEVEHKSHELGLDTAKSLKAHMYLKSKGVENTSEVVKKLYEIFGGTEENAIVTSATDADINKELEAIKASKKILLD